VNTRPGLAEFVSRFDALGTRTGTAIYIWHAGHDEFDEVEWCPQICEKSAAMDEGVTRMKADRQIVRIRIQYGGCVTEVNRNCKAA
jgi:hypothetical protein